MNRGRLWIIADNEQLLNSVFHRNIKPDMTNNSGIYEFIRMYQLGINTKSTDNEIQCMLAQLGYLVILEESTIKSLTLYTPRIVTLEQLNFIINNKKELINNLRFTVISLTNDNKNKLIYNYFNDINEVILELKKKNLIGIQKTKGMKKNVR